MRPVGGLFARVTDFHELRAAARRAAKGTRGVQAWTFLAELEGEVLELQRELLDGRYTPGPFTTFPISDPKPRVICAAPFRDRVVHHSLCAAMEPAFERYAVFDSYACRVGKGNVAAVRRAQRHARRFRWYAKLDVEHFFETVDLEVLSAMLRRRFRERRLLALVDRVLAAGAGPGGRGLPIGNLTSQHFGNFLLGAVDHAALERVRVSGWVRYMDDMLLFGPDKATISHQVEEVVRVLDGLGLKEKRYARVVAPSHVGVPFLGFRVWPRLVRLDGARKRRLHRRLRGLRRGVASGRLSEAAAAVQANAMVAWAEQADTLPLRQTWELG